MTKGVVVITYEKVGPNDIKIISTSGNERTEVIARVVANKKQPQASSEPFSGREPNISQRETPYPRWVD